MTRRCEGLRTEGNEPTAPAQPGTADGLATVVAMELLEPRLMLSGSPIITEFMASNGATLADEDGDYSDWIEIHNPDASAIDLDGYYLTDNAGDLTKWRLPATTVAGNGYLVVFASNKDRAVSGSQLHTDFKLSADGEYLALVEPDGTTIAFHYDPLYPRQVRDVSYGLAMATNDVTYITAGSTARALVPSNDTLELIWDDRDYPDAGWDTGTLGVGYDDATTYDPLIGLDVKGAMAGINATVYVRIPFEVVDPSAVVSLTLRMKYNDGFVAYLNGTMVADANAPLATLGWNSGATASRSDSQSMTFQDYNLAAYLGELVSGANVLAIQGLNRGSTSSEMLILPELIGAVDLGNPTLEMRYFVDPTPGAPNSVGMLGFVADVDRTVEHGFFDAPFDLYLSTMTPDATIVYTTDTTVPSAANGTIYTPDTAIDISTTTTLRTVALKDGYNPSRVQSSTYIFLDDVLAQGPDQIARGFPAIWHAGAGEVGNEKTIYDSEFRDGDYEVDPDVALAAADLLTIPSMSLIMEQDDLWDPYLGIYPNSIQRAASNLLWEKPASLELIDPNGGDGFTVNAGARISGELARWAAVNDKQSFRIVFKSKYGPTTLQTDFFGDPDVDQYDTIILRAHWGKSFLLDSTRPGEIGVPFAGGDPTTAQYLRDIYAHDAYMDTGNLGVRGRLVHLYLNGLYWGLYEVVERPDNSFNAQHQGGDKDDYDVIKGGVSEYYTTRNGILNDGSREAWTALFSYFDTDASGVNIAGQITAVSDVDLVEIAKYLDLTSFADYMITLWSIGRYDFPRKNWYAVAQRGEPGQPPEIPFKFYTWDSEASLGSVGAQPGTTWSGTGEPSDTGPVRLYRRLMLNATFQRLWMDRVQKHYFNDGALTVDANIARYMARADEIDRAIVGESARWGDSADPFENNPLTRDDWVIERDRIVNSYFPQRHQRVLDQMLAVGMWTDIAAPLFNQHGGQFDPGFQLVLTNVNASGSIWYTLDGSDPRGSATAIQYTGPIGLVDTTFIRVAAEVGGAWSPMDEAGFVPAGGSSFTITEVMYNPVAPPTPGPYAPGDFEFIEVANFGAAPVSLNQMKFADGIDFDFADGTVGVLQPDEYAVMVKNLDAFESRYGLGVTILGVYTGSLNNGGETIAMSTIGGFVFESFTYSTGNAWPGRADGKGASLELADAAGDRDDPDTWRSSAEYLGTPGGPGAGPRTDVVVNEVLTHTDDPMVDVIELHNTTAGAIDIGGWYLSDTWITYKKFRIPDGTFIPAGGYVLFNEVDFNASGLTPDPADDVPTDFGLSGAHGDDVWLMEADATDALTWFVDHVDFDAAANGVSFGRWPNATGDMVPMTEVTLLDDNSGPLFGPIVISEIMYNPGDASPDDLEFVEIFNPTDAPVDLTGWRLDKGVDYNFDPGISLAAGARLVILSFDPTRPVNGLRLDAFRSAYGIDDTIALVGGWAGKLNNAGERIQLQWADTPPADEPTFTPHPIEDEVVYNNVNPWPTDADGAGDSLHRLEPAGWGSDPASWLASTPTPGGVMARPGDADLDGDIDLDDFVILKQHFNTTPVGWGEGDFDGDGDVDLDDFVILKQNFATAAPAAANVTANAMADSDDSPGAPAADQIRAAARWFRTAPKPIDPDHLIALTRARGRQLAAAAKAASTGELVDLLDLARRMRPL